MTSSMYLHITPQKTEEIIYFRRRSRPSFTESIIQHEFEYTNSNSELFPSFTIFSELFHGNIYMEFTKLCLSKHGESPTGRSCGESNKVAIRSIPCGLEGYEGYVISFIVSYPGKNLSLRNMIYNI